MQTIISIIFSRSTIPDRITIHRSECNQINIMVYMTMIARVADGLPLAASIQEDEQV